MLKQNIIITFKRYYPRLLQYLGCKEEESVVTVNGYCKFYSISECIISTRELMHQIKSTALNYCWKKFWLEAVNNLGILQPAGCNKDHICISFLKFQGNDSQTWGRQISRKYPFLLLLS
jgi:hypothetical protein